jgi:hypothetical protein
MPRKSVAFIARLCNLVKVSLNLRFPKISVGLVLAAQAEILKKTLSMAFQNEGFAGGTWRFQTKPIGAEGCFFAATSSNRPENVVHFQDGQPRLLGYEPQCLDAGCTHLMVIFLGNPVFQIISKPGVPDPDTSQSQQNPLHVVIHDGNKILCVVDTKHPCIRCEFNKKSNFLMVGI